MIIEIEIKRDMEDKQEESYKKNRRKYQKAIYTQSFGNAAFGNAISV